MILETFCFGPFQTNAILLGCSKTKRAALIDPGVGSAALLLEALQKKDLFLEKILLTHSHWDHIAGVAQLKRETGAEVYVHSADAKNLESPGSDHIPLFVAIEPASADHLLHGGEILELGELKIHVIHTPGHSPGGVCFYLPEQKVLFSGDTLFYGTIGNLSLPTGSAEEMWPSLQKLSALPSDTRVIPGHGKETQIGRESWLADAKKIFTE